MLENQCYQTKFVWASLWYVPAVVQIFCRSSIGWLDGADYTRWVQRCMGHLRSCRVVSTLPAPPGEWRQANQGDRLTGELVVSRVTFSPHLCLSSIYGCIL